MEGITRLKKEPTRMSTQLQQVPQRLVPQRRPLDDEISQRLEPNSSSRSIRIGAESLKGREKFERNVGQIEDESTEVGSGEPREVKVDEEEKRGSVER